MSVCVNRIFCSKTKTFDYAKEFVFWRTENICGNDVGGDDGG